VTSEAETFECDVLVVGSGCADPSAAARVDAFLANGPEAVDFFTCGTVVRFAMPLTFPDHHAEAPGGARRGR